MWWLNGRVLRRFWELLQITSYLLRFAFHLWTKSKHSKDYKRGNLSREEIVISKERWLKYKQLFIVNSEKYENVKICLKWYYDKKRTLRLNTTISTIKNFNFVKEFTLLLRNHSNFTQLVILKVHEEHYHCGINSGFSSV